jgi:hypothetical protein
MIDQLQVEGWPKLGIRREEEMSGGGRGPSGSR